MIARKAHERCAHGRDRRLACEECRAAVMRLLHGDRLDFSGITRYGRACYSFAGRPVRP